MSSNYQDNSNSYNNGYQNNSYDALNTTAQIVGDSLTMLNDYHGDTYQMHRNNRTNYQQSRVPLPSNANLVSVNSPARSIRRTHSDFDEIQDEFRTVNGKKSKNIDPSRSIRPVQRQLARSPPPSLMSLSSQVNNGVSVTSSSTVNNQSTLNQRTTANGTTVNSYYNNQQSTVSFEATRYAQSRYPFQPFVVRFSSSNIKEQKVAEDLCVHLKQNRGLDIEFVGVRRSTRKCGPNEVDILLFVKDSHSFAHLYEDLNWPQTLHCQVFTHPSSPSIPPQLSLIVKNVGLHTDSVQVTRDLKEVYSDIKNVIRMKNRYQNEIKLVKHEFSKPEQRDEILNRGKIVIDSVTYEAEEFLAPARVLICSNCMGIGHFRKQCQQQDETCKICGLICPDLKMHVCSQQQKCIHCGGGHHSNDLKWPKVKEFRSNLTKRLLFFSQVPQTSPGAQFHLSSSDFPPLNVAQRSTIAGSNKYYNNMNNNNIILTKLNELNLNIIKLNDKLENAASKSDKFEQL
ncbi:unnamed protein product [Didymodactylos carnosus]|uniref:CCHC-type domain-containing protein n=1 Tax=Didymodactylos carnosus TaxID=1234261 RepID=A0A815FHJ7_9BILA|nr:unnamed protein product [Didymodactylos carnosus]CAF4171518.1 unnamed protein product [Didymodactylos carnosus]